MMKIVVLDGYAENPGDLSWSGLEALGELTVYDRTPFHDIAQIIARIGDPEIVFKNKTLLSEAVFSAVRSSLSRTLRTHSTAERSIPPDWTLSPANRSMAITRC